MENIIDYIHKNAGISFEDLPFNEVDALIFSQFAYLRVENYAGELKSRESCITLDEFYKLNKDEKGENLAVRDILFENENNILLESMHDTKRYGQIRFGYVSDRIDENIEVQFCGFVIFPPCSLPVVVFRGTDESIIGWKEDCNMVFARTVPGQNMAALYLKQVALRFEDDLYVAGHSKGGNFAVYASMQAEDELKKRIKRIYNFDGPGFRPEIYEEEQYKSVSNIISKFLPQSSIVGMILENHNNYQVVRSKSIGGILQHSPFNWVIADDGFVYYDELKPGALIPDKSFNDFIYRLDEHQMNTLIDTIFGLAEEAGVNTLTEIDNNKKLYTQKILKAMMDVDKNTRKSLKNIVKLFFHILSLEIADEEAEKYAHFLQKKK